MTVLSIDRKIDGLTTLVEAAEKRNKRLLDIKTEALSNFLGIANTAAKYGKSDFVMPVIVEALVAAAENYRDEMDEWWREAL